MKFFEIRDRATFIPVLAYRIDPAALPEPARYLAARCGLNVRPTVVVTRLNDWGTYADPYDWGGRTMPVAHKFIEDHFDILPTGAVVDVEFILKETDKPKLSERLEGAFDEMDEIL